MDAGNLTAAARVGRCGSWAARKPLGLELAGQTRRSTLSEPVADASTKSPDSRARR